MSTMQASELEILRKNSLFSLKTAIESIKNRDDDEESGSAYFNATYQYRALAVCDFLLKADRKHFFGFLCKSALLRLFFLKKVTGQQVLEPVFLCTSRNRPFVDALAAGAIDIAASIAELSSEKHFPEIEYEDDFLFYHFLHKLCLIVHTSRKVDMPIILKRWKDVIEGGQDLYFNVCEELFQRNSQGFDQALSELISARVEKVENSWKDPTFNPDIRLTEGYIFMHGLALIRLAELLGMDTQKEYETIPSMSRLPLGLPTPPEDSWRNPEAGIL